MALPNPLSNVYIQQGNGQVLLSWDLLVGSTSYTVQRSVDGVTYATVGTPSVPLFLDTTVTPNTSYYYQVAAQNGAGLGPYSTPQRIIPTITGIMSLAELRMQAQQRADQVGSEFLTLPEWNTNINQSYFELYDILVTTYGDNYKVAPFVEITTTGAPSYPLPDGLLYNAAAPIYKLLGVDLAINPGNNAWLTLQRYNEIDRNQYVFPQLSTNILGVANLRYRPEGDNLNFIPIPQSGQVIRLLYIPRMRQLLLDTDVCDGVSGWTEYIIIDAAIKAMQKEESDVTVLMAQKMAILQRIQSAAQNRDAGQPETISQTRRTTTGWDGGSSPIGGY